MDVEKGRGGKVQVEIWALLFKKYAHDLDVFVLYFYYVNLIDKIYLV